LGKGVPRMRSVITLSMVVAGFALQVVSYVFLSASWGFPPSDETYSNPAFPFAPLLFIFGVILVFLAAVVYELLPEHEPEHETGS
jgi:hypothetical protein